MFILLAFTSAPCSAADAAAGAEGALRMEKTQTAEAKIAFPPKTEAKFTELLENTKEVNRAILTLRMKKQVAELAKDAGLNGDGKAALEIASNAAIEKCLEGWTANFEKEYRAEFVESPAAVIARIDQAAAKHLTLGPTPHDLPEQQAAWKDGLAKLLTSDEVQHLADSKRERRVRRVRALGQMMLVEMDEKVAFTASQRDRLRPVAERLVDAPAFFPEEQPDEQAADFEPATFFAAALAVPENEMLEILDPAQCKRWREACDGKAGEPQPVRRRKPGGVRKNEANREATEPEPENFESAVSDLLYEKTAPVRKRLVTAMTLRVEETVRLGGLGPEPTRRLQIAVRGAAEESLKAWKTKANEIVRSRLGSVAAALGEQGLSSISDTLAQIKVVPADEQPVWETAVLAEMNEEQRAKRRAEIDERNRFKFKSIASLILAEIDRKVSISNEQWDKLEPMIAANTIECAAEITNIESEDSPAWYLNRSAMFLPVGGIPEKEITAILSKEQADRWRKTPECTYATEGWPEVQQMRAQRLKRPE